MKIPEEKIYFTLDKRIPETLYARYKDRKASIALFMVPEVIEKGGIMLYEETVVAAVNYLETILYFPRASKSERNKGCEELEEKPKVFI